jgi:hypothetical protein
VPNLTFAVPEKLYREMRKHPGVSWAAVARRALAQEANRLQTYDRLLEGSRLTKSDTIDLGRTMRRQRGRTKS